MARHAESKNKQKWRKRGDIEQNIAKAVQSYRAELMRPNGQHLGLRKIAAMYEGVTIGTLRNRAAGRRSIQEFNQTKHKLTLEDERQLTSLIQLSSNRGILFTREDIRQAVNTLLKKCGGSNYEPAGKQFVQRYLDRHYHELKTYQSKHLDTQRADSLNPTAVREWFNIIENEIVKKQIAPELVYGMDESGFPPANDKSFTVIGGLGKKIQPRRGGGSRENVTALVTICADGTSLKPLVIFKGRYLMSKWTENNISDARHVNAPFT